VLLVAPIDKLSVAFALGGSLVVAGALVMATS
jgi:hypothetical protein